MGKMFDENFINSVGTQFLSLEILLHKAFQCYIHMCDDQHDSIRYGTLRVNYLCTFTLSFGVTKKQTDLL